jgi:hypothetical protein
MFAIIEHQIMPGKGQDTYIEGILLQEAICKEVPQARKAWHLPV